MRFSNYCCQIEGLAQVKRKSFCKVSAKVLFVLWNDTDPHISMLKQV